VKEVRFGRWSHLGRRVLDSVLAYHERRKLVDKEFSLICNNCVAGLIYQKFGLKYTSPTVGLYFFSEDYITFLENFKYYIKQPLKFVNTSKHLEANQQRKVKKYPAGLFRKISNYPIGVLGDNIEIHFLHCKDEIEANDKWTRRTSRLHLNRLFFIYSDRDNFREEFFHRYEKLNFEHKIFFSSKLRANSNCTVFIPDYAKEPQVGDSVVSRRYEKYIDIIKWLNCENDFLKK
jgi:uncharacterized protein (DUF1919 family)